MSSKACKRHRAELLAARRLAWERAQRDRMLAAWRSLELDQARAHLCGLLLGSVEPALWHVPDWCVSYAVSFTTLSAFVLPLDHSAGDARSTQTEST